MRVLIVTNHFWPENFRITDMAVGLKERGHDVTVLTGVPDYPTGRYFEGYGIFKRRFEEFQGIKVARFPLIPRGRGKAWELVLNYLSSAFFSCMCAPFYCRGHYDVIFVFDTSPITIGFSAILLKKLKSVPMILWILDLWPESLSATGAVRSPFFLKLVRTMVRFIYRESDRILISSRGFTQSIAQTGGYQGQLDYFPNWVEPEYLHPECNFKPFNLPALPQGFLIMFAGNIGVAQDFETILSAAERLSTHPNIHWVIIGNGRMADWVRTEISRRNLEECFHMLGSYPGEMMPQFFSLADALLLTLKCDPIFALTVPGKLQSYMACGKPIIAGLNGEGAMLVKEADAGLVCPAESPIELANRVLELYHMPPEERCKFGNNAKRYCLEHFNRTTLFDFLEKLMMKLIREG